MKNKSLPLLISAVFLIVGFIFNSQLIQSSTLYKEAKEDLAETLSYKSRFLDKEEWGLLSETNHVDYSNSNLSITLPFGSSEAIKTAYKEKQITIEAAEGTMYRWTYAVLALILGYLLIMAGLYYHGRPPFLILIAVLSVSIVCLYAGLFTPMLEIGAIERDFNLGEIPIQKTIMGVRVDLVIEKQFEGDIYFYYQSKSIAELIGLLFSKHNYLVGFCILIFSVLFPIVKTCLMCYFVYRPSILKAKWFSGFVLNLSKWSMADVFVVAMFLGFLAFKNLQAGVGTYSNISVGLYFFLAYCLLSICSSMMAKMPTEEFFGGLGEEELVEAS